LPWWLEICGCTLWYGMFVNACSAQLFSDFKVSKPLYGCLVFSHNEECQNECKPKEMWFTIKPV
jgi:hypothetical protein